MRVALHHHPLLPLSGVEEDEAFIVLGEFPKSTLRGIVLRGEDVLPPKVGPHFKFQGWVVQLHPCDEPIRLS